MKKTQKGVTIRISEDAHRKLKVAAAKEGVTFSQLLVALIEREGKDPVCEECKLFGREK